MFFIVNKFSLLKRVKANLILPTNYRVHFLAFLCGLIVPLLDFMRFASSIIEVNLFIAVEILSYRNHKNAPFHRKITHWDR